jgi:hypothetical protein
MKKTLQIANGLAFGSTVFINYLSNTGLMNNTTIGEISDDYRSLFTPAGYTFAIWGVIYLLLFGFSIYQGRGLFVKVKDDNFVLNTGWWFVLSCVFNSLWVFAWIYEFTGLSCVFIFSLLFCLLKIVLNNRMELNDERFPVIIFVSWPFVIYAGWVTVASIANMSTYLVKIEWDGFGLSEQTWAIIMILIAVAVNLLFIWKRNMSAFALVGAWALVGIANANTGRNEAIIVIAFLGAGLLLLNTFVHGFKNRSTNPFIKFQQWRKSRVS